MQDAEEIGQDVGSTAPQDKDVEDAKATKTLRARCFCKAVHFTITVGLSDLPLPVYLCSCSICRHTHGAMSSFRTPLPGGVFPHFIAPSTLEGALTSYIVEGGDRGTCPSSQMFFCKTCGCHVGDRDLVPNSRGELQWRVRSSVFDDHGPQTFRIQGHAHADVATQGAGGMREWLPSIGNRIMTVWNPDAGRHTAPHRRPEPEEVDADGNERLRAQCHCGGVSFTIPRPSAAATAKDEHLRHYASPLDGGKWTGSLDLCDDCRLMDGTHVIAWAYVPLAQTLPRVPPDFRFGTLTAFDSTPGDVKRAFCGVCGATVFYSCRSRSPEDRPDWHIVDVAVGLLRAPEGIAAENWLDWRCGRISYLDSGRRYDAGFADSLKQGYENWGRARYGKVLDWKLGPPKNMP